MVIFPCDVPHPLTPPLRGEGSCGRSLSCLSMLEVIRSIHSIRCFESKAPSHPSPKGEGTLVAFVSFDVRSYPFNPFNPLLKTIGVRGKACAPQLMLLSSAYLTKSSSWGLTLKSRRDERPQTGAQAPGSSATIKEAPKGRQKPKHVVIKHVTCSVALPGLSFVNALVPGGFTPGCVLSHLRCLFSGQQ